MSSRAGSGDHWSGRIARARQLAAENASAAPLLLFYAATAEFQQRIAEWWRSTHPPAALPLQDAPHPGAATAHIRNAIDNDWVLGVLPDFLASLKPLAPPRLAADGVDAAAAEDWRARLESYWSSPADAAERLDGATIFVLEAILQPLAESIATARPAAAAFDSGSGGARCPCCGGMPVAGVLHEEGHGARRALVCGLCLTEWNFLRVVCVRCGERRFDALPIFTAEQFPHVRIEACDTCRGYLKTIDLTKDGYAVPIVDDLASVALDLWARDRGYSRIRANLLQV